MIRRSFFQKTETLVIVVLISALVWLYAEATVLKQDTKSVSVKFVEPTGRYAITPDELQSVSVTFSANSGQRQRFQQELAGQTLIIEVPPESTAPEQERTISFSDALLTTRLGELGITSLEAKPDERTVLLRELQTVNLEVVVDTTGLQMIENVRPNPATVAVVAPADLIKSLDADERRVTARLGEATVNGSAPGEAVANNVKLEYPEALAAAMRASDPWVTAEVQSVRIDYTVADTDTTHEVQVIPLYVSLPIRELGNFTARLDDDDYALRKVEVRGSAETIARLKADNGPLLWAEVRIPNPDVAGSRPLVTPVLRGVPGVTPASGLPQVTVILQRRTANP